MGQGQSSKCDLFLKVLGVIFGGGGIIGAIAVFLSLTKQPTPTSSTSPTNSTNPPSQQSNPSNSGLSSGKTDHQTPSVPPSVTPPPDNSPNNRRQIFPPPIEGNISRKDRITWGDFGNYFEVEGISFDRGPIYERLNFIATAKENFSSIRFNVKAYDSEGIEGRSGILHFEPNKKSWSKGERARVWTDLPHDFSKVEVER